MPPETDGRKKGMGGGFEICNSLMQKGTVATAHRRRQDSGVQSCEGGHKLVLFNRVYM